MDVNGHAYDTAGTRAVAAVTLVLLPAAVLDVVGITVTSLNVAVPPLGTLLCDPATTIVTVTSAAGVPFAVPIPLDCMFAGAQLCSQGASIDAAGNLRLANALDITLGMN